MLSQGVIAAHIYLHIFSQQHFPISGSLLCWPATQACKRERGLPEPQTHPIIGGKIKAMAICLFWPWTFHFLTHFHCIHDCFMIIEYYWILVQSLYMSQLYTAYTVTFGMTSDFSNLFCIGIHDLKLGLCLGQWCGLSICVISEKIRCPRVVLNRESGKVVNNLYCIYILYI